LKSHLKRWTENVEASTGKAFHIYIFLALTIFLLYLACQHDITTIVSLEVSLERVDFASRLVQDAKLHNDT